MKYAIHCTNVNPAHTLFNMYDAKGALVATLCIATDDVENFIIGSWNGRIYWHGLDPIQDSTDKKS